MDRMEEERVKLLARINGQEPKCRPRSYLELAGLEARLGRSEDAIEALREAIADGLDIAYATEIHESDHFDSLRTVPAFQVLLDGWEGLESALPIEGDFIYAKGERARCGPTLLCSMCNYPLVDPLTHAECGAQYCRSCVPSGTGCPQCNNTDAKMTRLTLRTIISALASLRVHCPRCQRVMERCQFDDHLQACEIPCQRCRRKILPSEITAHDQECALVIVSCSAVDVGCTWQGKRRDLSNHVRRCYNAKHSDLLRQSAAAQVAMEQRIDALEKAVLDGSVSRNELARRAGEIEAILRESQAAQRSFIVDLGIIGDAIKDLRSDIAKSKNQRSNAVLAEGVENII